MYDPAKRYKVYPDITHLTTAVLALKSRGIQQKALAQLAGISSSYLSHILKGRKRLTRKTLRQLQHAAQELDKEVGEFLAHILDNYLEQRAYKYASGQFWSNIVGLKNVLLVSGSVTEPTPQPGDEILHQRVLDIAKQIHTNPDWSGVICRHVFSTSFFSLDPRIVSLDDVSPETNLKHHDIILIGSPLDNLYIRAYLNYVDWYRLVMWMNIADYLPRPYIVDMMTGIQYTDSFKYDNTFSKYVLNYDHGLVTISRNPFNPELKLVAIMGIRPMTCTWMLNELFSETSIPSFINVMEDNPIKGNVVGHQFLAKCNYDLRTIEYTSFPVVLNHIGANRISKTPFHAVRHGQHSDSDNPKIEQAPDQTPDQP